tara:strand:- start:28043 stop:28954 length:912 start_codon:yes stop_codon:yes gene_type:complete
MVCPKSGKKLVVLDSSRVQSEDGLITYRYAGAYPVLVDFERSVLDAETVFSSSGASIIGRGKKNIVGRIAKRAVSPSPKKTVQNVSFMIKELKKIRQRPRVLVIGGGTAGVGMAELYSDPDIRLIAFDIYASPLVQFVADGHNIPLANGSVDGVIAQAVLEHVLEPNRVAEEIYRVLGKNGIVYAETPFMQQVHEAAFDFTRFTDSGHRFLFRRFTLLRSGPLYGAADQLLRAIDYFFRSLLRSSGAGKIAKLLFFWVKYFDLIIPDAYAVDAASAVFFLGRRSESAVTPREAISYYRGRGGG